MPYREAWARQKELVERRARDEIPDTIIFCEHDPVITLGRGAQRGPDGRRFGEDQPAVLNAPAHVEIVETERGGSATYHGPGQLVIYPIVRVGSPRREGEAPDFRSGVTELLRFLEEMLIQFCAGQGVTAGMREGQTGVWVSGPRSTGVTVLPRPEHRKIASLGIALRQWVSYHGAALNLTTGPEPWNWINPCGFDASVMTDLKTETGRELSYAAAVDLVLQNLRSLSHC